MLRLCNYKRADKRLVLMDWGILSFVSKNGNVTELICILSRLTQPDQKFAKHMCAELPLLESALHLSLCKHHSKWSNLRKLSALIMSTWTQFVFFCWLETVYLLKLFSRNCQFQLVAVIYLVCSFFSEQTQSVSANSSVGSAGRWRFSRVSSSSSSSPPCSSGRGRRFSLWPQVAPCLFIYRRRPARPPLHFRVVRLNNAFSMWMILWRYRHIHPDGVFHMMILEVDRLVEYLVQILCVWSCLFPDVEN